MSNSRTMATTCVVYINSDKCVCYYLIVMSSCISYIVCTNVLWRQILLSVVSQKDNLKVTTIFRCLVISYRASLCVYHHVKWFPMTTYSITEIAYHKLYLSITPHYNTGLYIVLLGHCTSIEIQLRNQTNMAYSKRLGHATVPRYHARPSCRPI
jgi:hypothetical protein